MDGKELALKICNVLDDKKALNIEMIDITELSILADYFVICSGRSALQVRSLADETEEAMAKEGILLRRTDGYNEGRWIVQDYGEVFVHFFHEEERAFYNLERLWSNGTNTRPYPFLVKEEPEEKPEETTEE